MKITIRFISGSTETIQFDTSEVEFEIPRKGETISFGDRTYSVTVVNYEIDSKTYKSNVFILTHSI